MTNGKSEELSEDVPSTVTVSVIQNKIALESEKEEHQSEHPTENIELKEQVVPIPDKEPDEKVAAQDKASLNSAGIRFLMMFSGVASILPFNIFLVSAGFFAIRLRGTKYATSFANYIQFVGVISNLVGSAGNVFTGRRQYLRHGAVLSNLIHGAPVGVMCILSVIDVSEWKEEFFEVSLFLLFVTGIGHALQTSCMNALINITSPSLTPWYFGGKGIAGLLAVCLNLITVSFPGMDVESAAFWYFLVTFILCFIAVTCVQFRFVCMKEVKSTVVESTDPSSPSDSQTLEEQGSTLSIMELTRKCYGQCLSIFMTTFISLTVYPALSTNLGEIFPDPGSKWSTTYFLPVCVFLVYAVGDIVGKVTSALVTWPGRSLIVVLSVVRLGLVPLLLMCNVQPRTLPVWFKSDAIAPIIIFITAVTGGHFINLNLMYAPTYVEGIQNKGRISTIMFFLLSVGMATASGATFGFSALINVNANSNSTTT